MIGADRWRPGLRGISPCQSYFNKGGRMSPMQYRTHEDGPLTTITVQPGAVCIRMDFDHPGAHTKLHSHAFDHWMQCVSGSARIVIDGVQTIVRAGDRYLVEAHKQHGVWPLESGTVLLCTHEHADIHPDKAGEGIPIEWLDRLTDAKRLEVA